MSKPAIHTPLQDGPVTLRPGGPADTWLVHDWRTRPHVRRNMYTDHPITPDEHAAWYTSALADPSRELWIIECDGAGIGTVLIHAIDPRTQSCSWAFYIGEVGVIGRGIGSRVEQLVIRHVFERLGLECLRCEVLEFNTAVLGLHRKFGFRETGRIENRVTRDGAPVAAICLELTRGDLRPATPPASHG